MGAGVAIAALVVTRRLVLPLAARASSD